MQHPALHYAEIGYRVFPCVGKRPLTPSGCKDATSDAAQIESWLSRWPNANWAIATDGLLIVDIDTQADGDNPWPTDYEQALTLAVAPISLTPSGGRHYLFRQPEGLALGNSVGKLAAHVDTRGNGGYIVVPPSVNDGKAYHWLEEIEAGPDQLPLPPDWLLDALAGTPVKSPGGNLPSEARESPKIPAGNRNDALTRMAGYLRRGGIETGELFKMLWTINESRCVPPLPEDEVRTIAKSIGRKEPDRATRDNLEGLPFVRPIIVNLGDVAPQPIRWLWPGRIALGKLTLIAGEPGQGKSTMTADLAARVTTGQRWPDDTDCPAGSVVLATPASVVLLSAEDDVADTIRPRLDAAGADCRKVSALQGIEFGDANSRQRSFNLESDLPLLEQAIQQSGDCRIVVVDPVSAYMGGTDGHKNADVRGLLTPLAELASRYGVAVVLVTHFAKGQNRKAMHAPTGSIAYIAAARAAWAVVADRHDAERRLFLPIKNNLAKNDGGLAFRIVDRIVNGDIVGAVEWLPERITMTADEALSDEPDRGPSALDEAETWLLDFLKDGSKTAAEVYDYAEGHGHSEVSIKRASKSLGVVTLRPIYVKHLLHTFYVIPMTIPTTCEMIEAQIGGSIGANPDALAIARGMMVAGAMIAEAIDRASEKLAAVRDQVQTVAEYVSGAGENVASAIRDCN